MVFFNYLFLFQFIRKGDRSSEYSGFKVCFGFGLVGSYS